MSHHPDTPRCAVFDATMRGHHAAAVSSLSPRARTQLAQRRSAALRGDTVHRGHGLRLGAAALATLCALAIGMQLRPAPAPADVAPVAARNTSGLPTGRAHATMLDEDPEFYAWLASPDAQLVAME